MSLSPYEAFSGSIAVKILNKYFFSTFNNPGKAQRLGLGFNCVYDRSLFSGYFSRHILVLKQSFVRSYVCNFLNKVYKRGYHSVDINKLGLILSFSLFVNIVFELFLSRENTFWCYLFKIVIVILSVIFLLSETEVRTSS